MGDWENLSIESIASVKTGPFGAQLHQRDYVKEYGTPIVTVEHLSEKGLMHKNIPLVSDADTNRLSQYILKTNDVVFSRVGSVDRCSIVSENENGWLFSGRLLRIRPKENQVFSPYLIQFFQTKKFKHHMRSVAVGGTMPSLNTEILKKACVSLPSFSEQKAIANVLQTWDTAIEKTEALIATKERQFDWLLMCLLNEQAQHTEKLGEHFGKDIVVEKGIPLVKKATVEGNIPVIAGGKTSPYSHNEYTHAIPCITVSASGAYAGFVWYHKYLIWASDCNVIYSEKHSTEYLYFALKAKQSKIYALQSGGGQPHVYARDIKNINIPIPPPAEQKRIAHILNTAKQEIDTLKKLADQYRAQKRGLMQKLLSGEWRVKI